MTQYFSPLLGALLLAAVPAVASADASDRTGVYGVAGLGKAQLSAYGKHVPNDKLTKDVGPSRLAYTLGAGYRINRYAAVESDFSSMGRHARTSAKGNGKPQRTGVSSRAVSVSALGIVPVGQRVELFGRAGLGNMQSRYTAGGSTDARTVKTNGLARQYGLGSQLHLSDSSFLRTEYSVLRARKGSDAARAVNGDRLHNAQLTLSYGYRF